MTTATRKFSWTAADPASIKVWIDGVRDVILAAGLELAADTGRIDHDAIPAAGYMTYFGFDVFQFPDALQADRPIFVKIGYEIDNNYCPRIGVQVSSATNGAGAMSTPLFQPNMTSIGQAQANLTSYACYVDATFTMVLATASGIPQWTATRWPQWSWTGPGTPPAPPPPTAGDLIVVAAGRSVSRGRVSSRLLTPRVAVSALPTP